MSRTGILPPATTAVQSANEIAPASFPNTGDASERTATADEIGAMQALVRAAMRDGAMGFTSSQLELHVAHDGRGVPSNYADHDELVALGASP